MRKALEKEHIKKHQSQCSFSFSPFFLRTFGITNIRDADVVESAHRVREMAATLAAVYIYRCDTQSPI